MKEESAVEFLFKQIYGDTGHIGSYTTEGKDAFEAFEKAKEMERRQIITAFCSGYDHDGDNYDSAETIYYKENYGGEQ